MRILAASDSFKGCLTSEEVGRALCRGFALRDIEAVYMALADGGEGTLDAFMATGGYRQTVAQVTGAFGGRVPARYCISADGRIAVVESAQAVGLAVAAGRLDPLHATSRGVGELIYHAAEQGVECIIAGLGGTCTSDAGIGAVEALCELYGCMGHPERLADTPAGRIEIVLASDVDTPLTGPHGAARVFGPQKGADARTVELIEARAEAFAEWSLRITGRDMSGVAGAGAAGGLGYALMEYLDARCESGADVVMDACGFDSALSGADVVVTGEGKSDSQTLMGKLPARVLARCRNAGKPVWLVSGAVENRKELLEAGFERIYASTPPGVPLAEAIAARTATGYLERLAAQIPVE